MQKAFSFKNTVVLGFFTLISLLLIPEPAPAQSSSADISRMSVVSNVQENGNETTAIIFDEIRILKLLGDEPGIKNLNYSTDRPGAGISLQFGPELLTALRQNNITMTLSTSLGAYVLDPRQLNLKMFDRSGTAGQETTVRMYVGKAAAEEQVIFNQFIQGRGLTPVLDPVTVKIDARVGNRVMEIPIDKDYFTFTLALAKAVDPCLTTGIMLKNDGSVRPVPTRLLTAGGKNTAMLKTREYGTFALVSGKYTFSDISSHWAKSNIELLASKLIVRGVGEASFAPEQPVSRVQAAAMLVQALAFKPALANERFTDVKENIWYESSIAAIVDCGVMRGYPGRVFRPETLVSREEAAVIAGQVMALTGENYVNQSEVEEILSRFKDRDKISSWARSGVAAAVKSGIMKGADRETFNPLAVCTRAEFAVTLHSVLVNAGLISPSVILTSPPENFYTNQEILNIKGKARPGNKLAVQGEDKTTGDDGSFDIPIKLSLGTNTLSLLDLDPRGITEKTVRTVVYDNTAPILTVYSPEDKTVVTSERLTVEGSTESGCVVKINDYPAEVDRDGDFRGTIDLNPGRNVLDIAAADPAGNKSHARRVVYSAPYTISGFKVSPDPVKLGTAVNVRFLLERDAYVTAEVFRENGDKVATLLDNVFLTSGVRTASWTGKDSAGSLVPDGNYRFVAVACDVNQKELARVNITVTAARVPQISAGLEGLPVFAPNEKAGIIIPYSVESDSKVTIRVFKGNKNVKTLAEDLFTSTGNHSIYWDGKDETGEFSGDGDYTCKIDAVSAQVETFKAQSEFKFVIERANPVISDFTVNPDPCRVNISVLNIRYSLSEEARVTLEVLDQAGKTVAWLLKDELQASGRRYILWNGLDSQGRPVPEGQYQFVISAVDNYLKNSEVLTQTATIGYEPFTSDVKFNPDPFYATGKNSAAISFNLSHEALVTVEVKIQWVTVTTIQAASREKPGRITIRWDGSDNDGYLVGEGRYDLQITAVSPVVQNFRSKYSLSFEVREPVMKDSQ